MHGRLTRLLLLGALFTIVAGPFNRTFSTDTTLQEATLNAFIGSAHAAEPAILVVNGTALTQRDLSAYAQARGIPMDKPDTREAVIQELISRELLYQQALAKGIDKNPDLATNLENQKRTLTADFMAYTIASQAQPTQEQMRAFYQKNVAGKSIKEYKTRHIVAETEGKAKEIIAALGKGGDFVKTAKEVNSGSVADAGGELGWMSLNQMVPPARDAVALLSKGGYTKTPVRTQFGWHVIRLDDVRDVPAPAFESVQNQIRTTLQQRALTDHIAKLRNEAKIQVNK